MEKRMMQRSESVLRIIIYQNNLPICYGCSANVGSGGIFVKSDCINLPDKNNLEIGFYNREGGDMKLHTLPVTFSHQSRNGVGLEFNKKTNDDIFTHALLGYVSSAHKVNLTNKTSLPLELLAC